ncbi:MAG: FAD-dependent oxidoreductase [Candidatus Paceibacterota bacterium]|jgi:alkyl hydroperoxide reductase subunit F
MFYDLVIIGGGPAGATAGIYATRKKLKSLLLAEELGGQSAVSPEIQNWIGEPSISGADLAKKIEAHLRTYEGENLVIKDRTPVEVVTQTTNGFSVRTQAGENYEAKTVIIAAGGRRRQLEVKGADVFEHKGLTYCASCDGPLFCNQAVVVIGGGNAGFGTAGQLLAYCQSVTLLETAPTFRAEQITIDKLLQNPKFQAIKNVELLEIKGDKFVSGLIYKDKNTGEQIELPVTGIFVEIGFVPNTEMVKDLVKLDNRGAIVVNHLTQQSSVRGIWAAGDCTDNIYHQNNIAVGDAVEAVEDIYQSLHAR